MLSLIYQAELQACVYDAFYQIMKPQYGDDPVECYEARFYSGRWSGICGRRDMRPNFCLLFLAKGITMGA